MKRFGIWMVSLLATGAWAGLPPVGEALYEVFSSRKPFDAVEMDIRHTVQLKDDESVEVVEHFVGNRTGAVVQWQIAGQPIAYSDWTGREYQFRGGKSVPSRTAAFIDYFLVDSGFDYQDRLLRESFLRRDQLLQYKPGYQPTGDPKTWDTKGNYLTHDDVSLQRVGNQTAMAIVGMNENGQKRTFFLSYPKGATDKQGRRLLRLEWVVGPEVASWDFTDFVAVPNLSRVPRGLSLTINGRERVKSVVSMVRPVKKDALATARAASKQPSANQAPSQMLEDAVRLIVRYR